MYICKHTPESKFPQDSIHVWRWRRFFYGLEESITKKLWEGDKHPDREAYELGEAYGPGITSGKCVLTNMDLGKPAMKVSEENPFLTVRVYCGGADHGEKDGLGTISVGSNISVADMEYKCKHCIVFALGTCVLLYAMSVISMIVTWAK
jgi:hypothetical protein